VQWLSTVRVGQVTGRNKDDHRDEKRADPGGASLLNDTTRWGAMGMDEGANCEHNGRLYFFPGDVECPKSQIDPFNNSHLVAWTEDRTILRRGGHWSEGFNFVLPHDVAETAASQKNWRYCTQCGGLFFDGYNDKTFQNVCPRGGAHNPAGFNFVVPHDVAEDANRQKDWRYCMQCGVLFFENFPSVCPKGGGHLPAGFNFVLPHDVAEDAKNQKDWRYCVYCGALFWDGSSNLGLCPAAPGGGFHLNAVLRNGSFWHFEAGAPVGVTLSLEPPCSAFSYGGRIYVFTGVGPAHWTGQTRPGDPTYGLYVVSSDQPDQDYSYRPEFFFNPRIGVCAADGGSHSVLGYNEAGHAVSGRPQACAPALHPDLFVLAQPGGELVFKDRARCHRPRGLHLG
jgi:hypothetical protein